MIVFIAYNICAVVGKRCSKGLHTFSVAVLQLHCTVLLQNGCAILCCQTKRKIRLPSELVQGDLIFYSVKLGIKLQSGAVTVGIGIRESLELLIQTNGSALLPLRYRCYPQAQRYNCRRQTAPARPVQPAVQNGCGSRFGHWSNCNLWLLMLCRSLLQRKYLSSLDFRSHL